MKTQIKLMMMVLTFITVSCGGTSEKEEKSVGENPVLKYGQDTGF